MVLFIKVSYSQGQIAQIRQKVTKNTKQFISSRLINVSLRILSTPWCILLYECNLSFALLRVQCRPFESPHIPLISLVTETSRLITLISNDDVSYMRKK